MSAKPTPPAAKKAAPVKPAVKPQVPAKPAVAVAKKPAKPTRINPTNKLTALMVNLLCILHTEGKLVPLDTLANLTGTTPKVATGSLDKLSALGLAESTDKGWRTKGLRCKALTLLVDNLRVNGGPMTASELGTAMWADPKVSAKDPKAAVRYIAPAGAVLKTAFELGVIYKLTGEGVVPTFGVVA